MAREARRLGVVPLVRDVVAEVQRARVRQVPRRPQHLRRRVHADDGGLVPFSQRSSRGARARAEVDAIGHGRRADDGSRRVDDVPGRVARVQAAVREGVQTCREGRREERVYGARGPDVAPAVDARVGPVLQSQLRVVGLVLVAPLLRRLERRGREGAGLALRPLQDVVLGVLRERRRRRRARAGVVVRRRAVVLRRHAGFRWRDAALRDDGWRRGAGALCRSVRRACGRRRLREHCLF
mmetsp:Transcript_3879/g.9704  ORF Transcript_3879/g.9704 Transcript_3879/m.9704 type:complete len:239 (-) Transcript_3879:142-858(-)